MSDEILTAQDIATVPAVVVPVAEPEVDHSNDQPIIQDPNWVEPHESEPAVFDPAKPSGLDHGTEVVSPHGNKERVVHETNEDGSVSWHKEHLGDADV